MNDSSESPAIIEQGSGSPTAHMQSGEPTKPSGFFATLIRRPITLLVIFATLVLIGVISYQRIPLQMMPNGIQPRSLRLWITHPGSSPSENEEQVARPLEEQLRTITGITDISSSSREDFCSVRVRFSPDQNTDLIKAEVRDRIERTRPSLPDTVERIRIFSFSQSQLPLMWLAILAKSDSDQTDYLLDTVIQRKLDAVDGVGQAQMFGALNDSIEILLDEDRVNAANLDLGALIGRLRNDNFAMPMGEITDGGDRILLRSDMRFKELDEIRAYPVGNGLTLGDLGRVERLKSVRDELSRIDGSYAYWGAVRGEGSANVVATCKRLQKTFDELREDPRLKGEFDFLVVFNQGEFIESALGQLGETALWGGGLALVVLFIFLRRVRLTLCVAMSIPISVLLSIAWAFFSGGTFNILTMTGITLALGMLVDNSVVVIENISRLVASGKSRYQASVEGVREVGLAVSLATLTTVVVFLPLIFMTTQPQLRVMFGELGMPLCLSLLFSLLVALIFLPVIAARMVGPRSKAVEKTASLLAPIAAIPGHLAAWVVALGRALLFGLTQGLYWLERCLLTVIAPLRYVLAVALIAWTAWSAKGLMESPESITTSLSTIDIELPSSNFDANLATIQMVIPALIGALLLLFTKRWRDRLRTPLRRPESFVPAEKNLLGLMIAGNRSLLAWSLRNRLWASLLSLLVVLSIGIPSSRMEMVPFGQEDDQQSIEIDVSLQSDFTLREANKEFERYEAFFEERRETYDIKHVSVSFDSNSGDVTLWFGEPRPKSERDALRDRVRAELPKFPGHLIRMGRNQDEEGDSRSRSQVVFRLNGPDPDELEQLGNQAVDILSGIPGLIEVKTTLTDSPEQVRLVMDSERAHQMGADASVMLQNLTWALRGFSLPRFNEPGREIPLLLSYDEEKAAGLDTLRDMQIWTGEGVVPLSSFAEMEVAKGRSAIYRRNGKTSFTILGTVSNPAQQQDISNTGLERLKEMDLPRGYSIGDEDLVGRRAQEEMSELQSALALSVVLVFLLMGILFESFLLPFSVLCTIPFAVTGAYWTLFLTGTTMDSVGYIGIIILVGVVVNNGIVLIDRVHRLRGDMDRSSAILQGTSTRVRPILMTALTTVFGLLPMALAAPPSDGIDYRALATCVAGGLTLSTFFTLWVVPLTYSVLDDFAQAVSQRVRWAFRPGKAKGLSENPTPIPS